MAQPVETKRLEPNQFTLEGYDTQITFSTSSISGVPQFSFSDRVETRNFSGDEIHQEDTGVDGWSRCSYKTMRRIKALSM